MSLAWFAFFFGELLEGALLEVRELHVHEVSIRVTNCRPEGLRAAHGGEDVCRLEVRLGHEVLRAGGRVEDAIAEAVDLAFCDGDAFSRTAPSQQFYMSG